MAQTADYQVVFALLDELSNEEPSVREDAQQKLSSLGAAAVPALLHAMDRAQQADGAARAIGWVKARKEMAVPVIVLVLAWLIASGAIAGGGSGAIIVGTGMGVAGALFLTISWWRSRRLEQTTRRGIYAREVLKTITDVRTINILAERLSRGHHIVSTEAEWIIERLLPKTTPDDWNMAILSDTKRKLAKVLVFSNADQHPGLLIEVLGAMARAGDTRVFYDIATMAASHATTPGERTVAEAAADYIHEIEHSIGRQRDKAILLRPTELPVSNLLRPAGARDSDDELLLRSALDESGQ